MAIIHYESRPADRVGRTFGSKLRRLSNQVGAAVIMPVVLVMIMLRPKWFEQDE